MMKLATHEIEILGEKLILTNQRVVFWPKESALILSDLHIGKTAHFRKNGIAIPKNIFEEDLERLEFLMNYFSAAKVIINGDLLHAGDNSDVDDFCEWKAKFEVEFHLVQGNHDLISKEVAEKLCLNTVQEKLEIGDFCFIHDFEKELVKFQITGHIHPGIVLRSAVKNFRMPCFALTENHLLLPAFSAFTGLDTKNTPRKAQFFVFSENEIYQI